jgi:acetyl-CoA carboxylase carboxyltransferase component
VTDANDWKPRLDELARRLGVARAMGGPERLARQRRGGRLDARARIDALLDPGSFREIGALVGTGPHAGACAPADAFVMGLGSIDGRPVLVGAEDFTVLGGSIGIGTHAKRVRLARLAGQERAPLVLLLDGAGERASNALERYPFAPNDLQELVVLSGRVPVVAVVLGASAGHGALGAALADHVIGVEGAALFAAGPRLVEAATGERVDAETLGGMTVHAAHSGLVHDVAASDGEALALARRWLSYFPSNAWEYPRRLSGPDTGERSLDGILDLVPSDPRRPYDGRALVSMLVDAGSELEVGARFGGALLTVLARLGGEPVAVVASQPLVRAGAIDRDAAEKAARFVERADAFHLPLLFLADTPGVWVGAAAEREGVLRAAAALFAAQSRARVAKLHVTVRKAYGFGSSVLAMNPFDGQTLSLAFPGAQLAAMPGAGAAGAAKASSEVRDALAAAETGGPWAPAEAMAYDEVVDPRELRNTLLAALRLARGRRSAPAEPVAHVGLRP